MFSLLLVLFLNLSSFQLESPFPFNIKIEQGKSHINLLCSQGCEWTNLSFNVKDNVTLKVTQYGITGITDKSKSSKFEFHITKKGDTYKLEGKKGTAWTQLNFSCMGDCNGYLDHIGITIRKR